MLIIRKYIGPAAAIMPARLVFKIPQKVWLPADAALCIQKNIVRERDAAKIHRASRGAAHNHISMHGVLPAIERRFYSSKLVFLAGLSNVGAARESKVHVIVFLVQLVPRV